MGNELRNSNGAKAFKILALQFLVSFALALGLGLAISPVHGYSAFVGGGICVLAGSVFAIIMFCLGRTNSPHQVLWSFYFGELVKILVTVGLFLATIKYLDLVWWLLLSCYFIVASIMWFALLFKFNEVNTVGNNTV